MISSTQKPPSDLTLHFTKSHKTLSILYLLFISHPFLYYFLLMHLLIHHQKNPLHPPLRMFLFLLLLLLLLLLIKTWLSSEDSDLSSSNLQYSLYITWSGVRVGVLFVPLFCIQIHCSFHPLFKYSNFKSHFNELYSQVAYTPLIPSLLLSSTNHHSLTSPPGSMSHSPDLLLTLGHFHIYIIGDSSNNLSSQFLDLLH